MNISGVIMDSIVDGPGIRMTVFFQGCPHHCIGCQNPETWDYNKKVLNTLKKKKLFIFNFF